LDLSLALFRKATSSPSSSGSFLHDWAALIVILPLIPTPELANFELQLGQQSCTSISELKFKTQNWSTVALGGVPNFGLSL